MWLFSLISKQSTAHLFLKIVLVIPKKDLPENKFRDKGIACQ